MMSRAFPKKHRRQGMETFFMEKILASLGISLKTLPVHLSGIVNDFQMLCAPEETKLTTIRAGNRWKAGDMASLRVWSDKPYCSKQVEFAQVQMKKVWEFEIKVVDKRHWGIFINKKYSGVFDEYSMSVVRLAKNDGLTVEDFVSWFSIHPKMKAEGFTGQIITWDQNLTY
jgi:hypothetical protein